MLKNVTLAALLTALPCSFAMATPGATAVNDHEEKKDEHKKDDHKKDKKGEHHDEHDDEHHDDHAKPKH
jgi:hypothetical protein